MEWADGSQPVRQTVGCGKWAAVSLLTYRDCRHLCVVARRQKAVYFSYTPCVNFVWISGARLRAVVQ